MSWKFSLRCFAKPIWGSNLALGAISRLDASLGFGERTKAGTKSIFGRCRNATFCYLMVLGLGLANGALASELEPPTSSQNNPSARTHAAATFNAEVNQTPNSQLSNDEISNGSFSNNQAPNTHGFTSQSISNEGNSTKGISTQRISTQGPNSKAPIDLEISSAAIASNYFGLEGENTVFPVLPDNLSIPALIKLTLATHPEVQSQLAALEGAQERVKSAKWQFFPTPSVTYNRAYTKQGDVNFNGDNNTYSLILDQPLWTGGRLRAGLESAVADKKISDAQLLNVRRGLSLTMLQNYGEWLTAWLQQRALQTSLETHQKLYDQVNRRKIAGLSTGADLSLADGRLQSTKAQLAANKALEQRALTSLRQITGFDITGPMLAGAQQDIPQIITDRGQAIDLALASDPAMQMAMAQVASTRAALKSSKSILKPELSVRLERTFGDFQTSNAGPDNRIVLGFNTRFGAGLSSLSGVSSATAEVKAATAAIASSRRVVTDRLLGDLALLDSFDARIKALLIALETAQEVSESYGRQFLAGRKSWLDRINSARDLQQAELQLSDALAARLVVTWRIQILINGVDGVLMSAGSGQ